MVQDGPSASAAEVSDGPAVSLLGEAEPTPVPAADAGHAVESLVGGTGTDDLDSSLDDSSGTDRDFWAAVKLAGGEVPPASPFDDSAEDARSAQGSKEEKVKKEKIDKKDKKEKKEKKDKKEKKEKKEMKATTEKKKRAAPSSEKKDDGRVRLSNGQLTFAGRLIGKAADVDSFVERAEFYLAHFNGNEKDQMDYWTVTKGVPDWKDVAQRWNAAKPP